MITSALGHLAIRTTKLEETAKFYAQVMNYCVGPRPEFPFAGRWLYNGDQTNYQNAVIHLIGVDNNQGINDYLDSRDDASLIGSGAVDHIAFSMIGYQQMITKLTEQRIVYKERTVPNLQLQQIFVTDPNGIVLELNFGAIEK